ncbi:MAG: ribonuclease HI [Bacteroidales bacterium]|nr:ribonuclease HI [Bacteroidales bacterium]
MIRQPITLYTDGSSSGNPGPGGYGIVLECGNLRREISGGYLLTTNNRMELMAVIVGLEAIRWQGADVNVVSDSSYVVKAINEGWLTSWQAKGWKKVKNPDLWQRLAALLLRHNVRFHWVKGHAGHPQNECCDRLAVAAGEAARQAGGPIDEGYEANKEVEK